jgi:type VI secretion system protein ImpA
MGSDVRRSEFPMPDELPSLAPISAGAPCGPDLDLAGDGEFMNYLAGAEGHLPSSYFAFDRKLVDFAALSTDAHKLLERTHDIRLLALLAKLAILNRDLKGFSFWLSETARLVDEYWDEVHPRGEDGDFGARMAQLATFNDGPVVILPLQYAPLAETQRDGAVSFRAQLVALGEAPVREGETMPDSTTIERILLNSDIESLKQTLASLQAIKPATDRIKSIAIEKAGFEQAPSFEALDALAERMTGFVQGALARRDPSFAPPEAPATAAAEEGERPAGVPTAFASLAEVDAALAAAFDYFARSEPSSAAVLLIGQARRLLGKNIFEVMQVLAPTHAETARVYVGGEASFAVPVSSLGPSAEPAAPPAAAVEPAASRAAALALLDSVGAHLRKVEPSSPVPFLLDRARGLASRDFLGLLKELLSEDALAQMRQGS